MGETRHRRTVTLPLATDIGVRYGRDQGFPSASVERIHLQRRGYRKREFDPWVGKILWRRAWQPTPVFLPGESRGQRSLVGYSPWGHKESNMTEAA